MEVSVQKPNPFWKSLKVFYKNCKLRICIAQLLKAIWLYLAGIIAVGIIYFLLVYIEQGKDILILFGESKYIAIYGVGSILLWAFLVWYSSRFVSYLKQAKEEELDGKAIIIPPALHKHIPRLLAVNCFAGIQLAILYLPSFQYHGLSLVFFILWHNLLYFTINFSFKHKSIKNPALWFSILSVIANLYIWLDLINRSHVQNIYENANRHKMGLPIVGIILLIFEILVIVLFILRREHLKNNVHSKKKTINPRFLPKSSNHIVNYEAEKNTLLVYYIMLFLAAFLYSYTIFSVHLSSKLGPLAFFLLALGILVSLSNIVTYLSIWFSINAFLFLYLFAFLIGLFFNPYEVRFKEVSQLNIHKNRPSVASYFEKWIYQRKALLDSCISQKKKFDVYIVLSNGGASRAGNWVSSVLSGLQDTSEGRFREHLLCIAGASGGSVGNCAFYSLLKYQKESKIKTGEKLIKHCSDYFESDFLTYTLGRFLGLDIFRHFLPINTFNDRAAALEDVLTKHANDRVLRRYFNKYTEEVFDTSGDLPFLFINSTRVEDGLPGVISVSQLPKHSQRLDLLTMIDAIDTLKGRQLKLSTAAILSSRFPYVSPAGKIGKDYFVDGGYFDNSGAGIMLEFMQEINAMLANKSNPNISQYDSIINIHLVHIYNSEVFKQDPSDIKPLTNDLFTPLLTLAGMQGSSTKIGNGILKSYLKQDTIIEYSLYDRYFRKRIDYKKGTFEEGYPMSWVTSAYQLDRMRKSLVREDSVNFHYFKEIIKK